MSTTIKYKLEDFEADDESILIGIISSAPDYTVCWHINKHLKIDLRRCEDVHLQLIKKTKKNTAPDLFTSQVEELKSELNVSAHHVFKYIDEQLFSDYYFIANKGTRTNLDLQLKRISYFLEVNGIKADNAEQLMFDLNAIEPIEMAYLIGRESIINKLQLPI